jgi:CubicO group peptidase (beta-lactamase class C family)
VAARGVRLAVLTVVAASVLAGCSAGGSEPVPDDDVLPHLTGAVDRIPDRVNELLSETGVPGLSVAVVHGDRVVYANGFGTANLDTGAIVDADTMFQLASVSKPVGASLISALIGRGDLTWDTLVTSQLPGFALGDPWVTSHLQIADLYSHRSGLPDHAGDDLSSFGVDRDTILERLRYLPLQPFREDYAYTNFGIQTAAMAAATAAGGDWTELSEEALYRPLGMDRTTSSYAAYTAADNHAVGHSRPDGEWIVTPEQLDDDVATAAGGVASSASDMATWLRMLLAGGVHDGKQVVDGAALAEAMVPQMLMPMHPVDPSVPRGGYGFGFQTGVLTGTDHAFVSHSGAFSQGAGTMAAIVPALDLGVVVLTNGFPIGLAEAVSMEIVDWAQHGELTRDWWGLYSKALAGLAGDFDSTVAGDPPADAAGPGPLGQYTGAYRNDYFGDATVQVVGDALQLTMTPAPEARSQTWTLEPYDGTTFRVLIDNVDASPVSVSAVSFDPAAGTFTFEFFDHSSGGAGTFTRAS